MKYIARLQKDGLLNIPLDLVKKLDLQVGDEIEWVVEGDRLKGTVIYHDWQSPEWMADEIDHE